MTELSHRIDAPGAWLHALERSPVGQPTLLFLHGWLDHAHSFDWVRDALPSSWRTIALDFRGMGQSAHVESGLYHLTDYLLDVEFTLAALKVERAHLVGHSLGGSVALLYAAARPSAVLSVTTIESLGPTGGSPERALERLRASVRDVHRARHRRVYPDVPAAAARLREANPDLSEGAALHLARFGTSKVEGGVSFTWDPAHRRTFGSTVDEGQTLACFRAIECPVKLIRGTRGFAYDEEKVRERLQALRARAPVSVEGGHHAHLDQPDEVAALIRSFIAGV